MDAYDIGNVFKAILMGLIILSAIVMTVCILLQSSTSGNLGSITGGSDTFFGKNKGKTLDGIYRNITIVCISIIAVSAIIFSLIQTYVSSS